MSRGVRCPRCGANLFPDELADGQCTRCRSPLPADLVTKERTRDRLEQPQPDDDDSDDAEIEPRRSYPGLRRTASDWGNVQTGVTLVFMGMMLIPISLAAILVARLVRFEPMLVLSGTLGVIGGVICLIGAVLFSTIPVQSGGRTWAYAGLGCLAASIGTMLLPLMARSVFEYPFRNSLPFASVTALVLLFVASLFYSLTLSAAARFWGRDHLARRFMAHFHTSAVGGAVIFLVVFLVMANDLHIIRIRMNDGVLILLIGFAMLVFPLVQYVWYLILLSRLRQVIPTK